jgi:3-methyladenine DNA glycosylase AlkD
MHLKISNALIRFIHDFMPTNKSIIQDCISSLESLTDKKRAEMAKYYYPTTMRTIGVTVPDMRIVLNELKTSLKSWTPEQKIEMAKELCNTSVFECRQLGYELIHRDKKTLKALTAGDIRDLGRELDNWVTVDTYSSCILGVGWRTGLISDKEIAEMQKSKDFWIRRTALVATLGLNQKARGGTGDTARTIALCENAVSDHEDMVVKALSWALRELSGTDKPAVIAFIEKHKDRLHKRVLREVGTKLTTGLKNAPKL